MRYDEHTAGLDTAMTFPRMRCEMRYEADRSLKYDERHRRLRGTGVQTGIQEGAQPPRSSRHRSVARDYAAHRFGSRTPRPSCRRLVAPELWRIGCGDTGTCPPRRQSITQTALLSFAAVMCALLATSVPVNGANAPLPLKMQRAEMTVDGRTWALDLPVNCSLETMARMDSPRLFTFDKDGTLIAGSSSGHIYRLSPPYKKAESMGLLNGYPHSVALQPGRLLIAKTDGLYFAPWPPTGKLSDAKLRELAPLPGGGGHTSRSVAVGPDGGIYLGVGISGNCSDQYIAPSYAFEQRRGGVMRWNAKHRVWLPFATGLRNPIGFDWQPGTNVMYVSNHGPDHHGYDQPGEYFVRATEGAFFGMPWFWFDGEKIRRDQCVDSKPPRTDVLLPEVTFPARNGPMGVAFAKTVQPGVWRSEWREDAVVALHGSWATKPGGGFLGPRSSRRPPSLQLVRFAGGRAVRTETLLGGLQDARGERLMRPIGVGFAPAGADSADGALYFTSDGGLYEGLVRMSCPSG